MTGRLKRLLAKQLGTTPRFSVAMGPPEKRYWERIKRRREAKAAREAAHAGQPT